MDAFAVAQLVLRLLIAALFLFAGVSHFVPRVRRTMAAMVPDGLAGKGRRLALPFVTITGVAEIIGGVALLAPWWGVRFAAAIGLIALLIAVFPANMQAARQPERFGAVALPLVPRAIVQVLLGLLLLASVV